jgi:hypothetical protein
VLNLTLFERLYDYEGSAMSSREYAYLLAAFDTSSRVKVPYLQSVVQALGSHVLESDKLLILNRGRFDEKRRRVAEEFVLVQFRTIKDVGEIPRALAIWASYQRRTLSLATLEKLLDEGKAISQKRAKSRAWGAFLDWIKFVIVFGLVSSILMNMYIEDIEIPLYSKLIGLGAVFVGGLISVWVRRLNFLANPELVIE